MLYLYNKIAMTFNIKEYQKIQGFIKKNTNKHCKIIAISKNHPLSSVVEALNCGIKVFGENRVQEAQEKFEKIKGENKDIELHLTGPLQTNKVKSALMLFDVFHTLDREKLAREFKKNKDAIQNKKFFIQLNTGAEETKSGVYVSEADRFIEYCKKDLGLNIEGLMCIPPIKDDPNEHFLLLKNIAKKNKLNELSMGMSDDYEKGVLSGATCVRVGTKLFGVRNAN
jgi:pyridoxal phosphate enzyme (YggS family)|tara:strand:- start:3 stop:680 length:678 start_codon:yes stop_codon:yes gene_type:complete